MSDEPVPIPAACADAVRRMWQLLDGDLDAVEHAEVDAHLVWCLRCCGELAFARELQHLLRTRADVALSAGAAIAERFYAAEDLGLVPEQAVAWALGIGDPVRHAASSPAGVRCNQRASPLVLMGVGGTMGGPRRRRRRRRGGTPT